VNVCIYAFVYALIFILILFYKGDAIPLSFSVERLG